MKPTTVLFTFCLLASCQGEEENSQSPPPAGAKLPNLPTAVQSRPLESDRSNFIDIIISEEVSELFHQGKPFATTSSEKELFSELRKLRETLTEHGKDSPVLISAPAPTPFKTIKQRVRTAAKTGIHQIHFLVRSQPSSTLAVVSIGLPTASEALQKIEPYFLQADSKGRIFSGTGSGRTRMDSGNQDRHLDKLAEQLELFSAAAKAAGVPNPPCQIHVHPDTTFQRFIDLVSLTNKYRINPFFTDIEPKMPKPIERAIRKPTPPNSYQQKPLGLAPNTE